MSPNASSALTESDEELAELAGSFRQRRGPLTAIVIANLVLAGVALGVPGYRGRLVAREAQSQFSAFAACLFDGTAQDTGGLGLPPGTDDRFAARVLHADAGWPASCERHLRAIPPPDAIFLFPSIKRTAADVRAVVAMLEQEFEALSVLRERGIGQVPERPLLLVEKLRATLMLLAEAAGTDGAVKQSAITLRGQPGVHTPARLPIMGRPGGSLSLWGMPNGIEVVATDRIGISWLSLDDGDIDRRRARRSGLVRGVVVQDQTPYVLWATPERRCQEREDRCARRATGFAPFDRGSDTLPEPLWLAGHPHERIDRGLWVRDREVVMLVRGHAGEQAEVRRFALPRFELSEVTLDTQKPVAGERVIAPPESGVVADALLLDGRPARALFMQRDVTGAITTTLKQEGGGPSQVLPAVAGPDAWSLLAAPCEGGAGVAFAYGTGSQVRVAFLPAPAATLEADPRAPGGSAREPEAPKLGSPISAPGGASLAASAGTEQAPSAPKPGVLPEAQVTPPLETALLPVLDRDIADLDRARLLCDGKSTTLLYLDSDHRLWSRTCTHAGQCGEPRQKASRVRYFDALLHKGGPVYALSGDKTAQQIRVLAETGKKPVVPAPCWDPRRGLCAVPRLVSDGDRLILAARDGSDLLTMESPDGGKSWKPMSGVQVDVPVNTDPLAPMRQHMIRKGLEQPY